MTKTQVIYEQKSQQQTFYDQNENEMKNKQIKREKKKTILHFVYLFILPLTTDHFK